MTRWSGIALILLGSVLLPVAAESRDALFDQRPIELVGLVSRQDFPGRPNYESIENGDEKETYWILSIPEPTRFQDTRTSAVFGPLHEFQLILSASQYKQYEVLVGYRVVVSGALVEGTTGHHKTELLVEVQSMSAQP